MTYSDTMQDENLKVRSPNTISTCRRKGMIKVTMDQIKNRLSQKRVVFSVVIIQNLKHKNAAIMPVFLMLRSLNLYGDPLAAIHVNGRYMHKHCAIHPFWVYMNFLLFCL